MVRVAALGVLLVLALLVLITMVRVFNTPDEDMLVVGLLVGSGPTALGASPALAITIGAVLTVLAVALAMTWGFSIYRRAIASLRPVNPTR